MTKKEYQKLNNCFHAVDYIKNWNNKTLNWEQEKRIIFIYDILKDITENYRKRKGAK